MRWKRLVRVLVLAFSAMAVASASPQQATPSGSDAAKSAGLILGQVVDAVRGQPVSGATVTLGVSVTGPVADPFATAAGTRRVITDSSGEFLFRDLAAGTYSLSGTASGYMMNSFGQRRPGGPSQPFVLRENERVGNATLRLWKTASLGGAITDETGEPLVGLSVSIVGRMLVGGRRTFNVYSTARTDDRGIFRAANLTPGDYLVLVLSAMSSLPVAVAQAYEQTIAAAPAGNITNTDMYKALSASRAPIMSSGLRAGDDLIQFSPITNRMPTPSLPGPDGKWVGYATTFFANATASPQATTITLAPGEDRSNIDFQLKPVPMMRVSGTVNGPEGPMPNFGVRLVPSSAAADGLGDLFEIATTATDAIGRFAFPAVPAGQYTLKASKVTRAPISGGGGAIMVASSSGGGVITSMAPFTGAQGPFPTDATLWAETPVAVGDRNVAGVNVQLEPGIPLSGHVSFDGASPPTADKLAGISIQLSPADMRSAPFVGSRVSANGDFITQGYAGGPYVLSATAPAGWYLKSATSGGRDLAGAVFTLEGTKLADVAIAFTDKPTLLSGTVHDATGKPDPAAMILVVPADYQAWIAGGAPSRLARNVMATQTATFRVPNLVPGEYLAAAVTDDTVTDWLDPKFVQAVAASATRVTLAAGDSRTIDLKSGKVVRVP